MAITLENRKQETETGKKTKRGFALLIAVVFMSVMLSFGLALGSLSYKQQVLASSAIQSQYAFYAADAGLECALYADQQENRFAYPPSAPSSAPTMTCDGSAAISASFSYTASQMVVYNRVSLDSNKRCADVTVYKPSGAGTTYLFSQGYDVSCATVANPQGTRFVARGINVHY
ncbi:pilus assembly PilX N-terminal domain-containing protein [Candidatus Kaiserbacteria bacterium]|nr:pilus assembly PilX N-terminal domain-containing protein [Candidatus Kaiserbacteria bacterium]